MVSKQSGQAFTQSYMPQQKIQALQFGLLSPDTIAKMSVAEIKSPVVYDEQGMPNYQAINDPRMGVINRESRCMTCKGTQVDCPGHFGHIELTYPVFHAGLFPYILKFLRSTCFNCSKLLAPRDQVEIQELLKIRSAKSRFIKVTQLAANVQMCDSDSGGCGYKQPKFRRDGLKLEIEYQHESFDQTRDRKESFWPDQAYKVLSRISDHDSKLLGLDPTYMRPEWVIIKNLAVAPPPVRPSVVATASLRSEDDLTFAYQSVIKINRTIKDQLEKGANMTTINELRTVLQFYVCSVMDNRMPGNQVQKHKSGKPLKSIRERLKGKEGRLRGNLMGKRVDFSARTVITPDPNLKLDELGVPHKVATGLTVPEYVTPQNMHVLRQLVENGPTHWPGAKYIIRSDDKQIDLSYLRMRSDVHLEPGYIVERHLQDGDYVLFNRQPSLHKMSIMGHRVKVLPQNTFRLNLSVTTPYNADFDGDEMNMHVPQSYETMAEIKEIMAVPTQIISPQSNKPVMGVVQDSLLGVMMFTLRDTFLDKETVMNLLMWVNCDYQIPQPAIIKPKPLWTGKQLFSLILPKVNLIRYKNQPWDSFKDSNILIEDGELLCGVMTKAIVGSTGQGLVHIIWKEHGHATCGEWLSSVQNVLNNWLVNNGFTVGVQDIIVKDETMGKIQGTLAKFKRRVMSIIQQANAGKLKSQPGKSMMESFEAQVNKKLNDARDKSGNLALEGLVSYNRLRNMVTAGSKGSNINISQIMACVGQQNVEGKRIPYGFNKRTLPHFSKDDFGPESKGFVQSCYLSGLSPSEFYFHAMGGREGLIDTAVKTAETGYISRRLIKALEDVMVNYDGTVRDSRKGILQFLYGEDGVAGEHVEDLPIELLKLNDAKLKAECSFVPNSNMTDMQLREMLQRSMIDGNVNDIIRHQDQLFEAFEKEYNQIRADRKFLRDEIMRDGQEQGHLPINLSRMIWNAKNMFQIKPTSRTDLHPSYVIDKVKSLCNDLSVIPGAKVQNASQIIREHDANSHQLLNVYLRHMLCSAHIIQKQRLNKGSFDWLLGEIKSRFEQSLVQPGEMVGSVAAQSMGEPATQMTLNTFHFAGISTKNVTLGVPRLREIINVATNIKTPSLKIYLKDKYRKKENVVTKLGGLIEHTTLSHVVSSSGIYYDPDPERTIIPDDQVLVSLYNEVPVIDEQMSQKPSPWLLRFELDADRMVHKDLSIAQIDKKMHETFMDTINLMVSDENSEKLIMRLRVNNIEDDDEQTVPSYLKEFEEQLLTELTLKGFHEIEKVTFTKCHENSFDKHTGQFKVNDDNWVIETDGIALAKILSVNKVDNKRTISNDLLEVLKVIGIEAARQSLINELRLVFGSYGIYVNYRHISTLCDIMTQRGKLTSITRHGINRVDSGPLRKCSFEETVEILLEGSIYAEKDCLTGISENVIMGQLAHFGSGSIDIKLDFDCVENNAKTQLGQDLLDRYNAMQEDMEENLNYNGSMTPLMMTPQEVQGNNGTADSVHSVATSMYSPNHGGVFTPTAQDMQSPEYGSPYAATSPAYGNIYTAQSPIYGGVSSPAYGQPNMQSPIYQGGFQSPIYNNAAPSNPRVVSPGYAPPTSPLAVSQIPIRPTNAISPSYSPSSMQSPAYGNPKMNMNPNQNYSAQFNQGSSPAYMPKYMGDGKRDLYVPSSSLEGGSSAHSSERAAKFMMQSPAYNPATSPAYNRAAAMAMNSPVTSTINGGGTPINEGKYMPGNQSSGYATIKEERNEDDKQ